MTAAERLKELLAARGETVAVAETTAGGLVSAAIVGVPGSSAVFDRGVVAYSKASKIASLGIDESDLTANGAVSPEMAALMAEAVRKLAGTTYGVAETGIAGPIRGRSPKPIGTVHVAVAGPAGTQTRSLVLTGDRQVIREGIAEAAIAFLIEVVEGRG